MSAPRNPRAVPKGKAGGTPPEASRFKPGESGNAKGRPKKAVPPGPLNPLEQAFRDALVKEGARLVTMNEGGKQVTMPASLAVLRSTYVAAIRGSAHAQKTLIMANLDVERRVQNAHVEMFRQALDQKLILEEQLFEWLASGRLEENKSIHPSDIEIDPVTLDVRLHVPPTAEMRDARDNLIKARDELLDQIAIWEAGLFQGGPHARVSAGLEQLREMLAKMNDALPPRLRRERRLGRDLSEGWMESDEDTLASNVRLDQPEPKASFIEDAPPAKSGGNGSPS